MRIRFFEERPRFARNRAQQSHCCGLSRMLAHAQSHGMRSFEKYSQSRTGDSPVRYKHDTPTGFAKGFVSFDLLFCAIPLLLMLSHFLIFVWMATQGTETSLRYGETTGKLATIADYLVKKNIVKTRQEAFDKYLVKCDVPKYPLYLEEASKLVREAGGKLVLAQSRRPWDQI